MLNRFIGTLFFNSSSCLPNIWNNAAEGFAALTSVAISHQFQQIRHKSMIKYAGYREIAAFKQKDIRYKTSTRHDPKRMSWHDYQVLLLGYP